MRIVSANTISAGNNLVANGSDKGSMELISIESETHKFQGCTGNRRTDNICGISWFAREGYGHDWGFSKLQVKSIKMIDCHDGRKVLCAVID